MFNKLWEYVVGLFALLTGAFLFERSKAQDAEAKLDSANAQKTDATLAQHTQDLQEQIKQDAVQAQKAKDAPVTDKDLLDFLNKKG